MLLKETASSMNTPKDVNEYIAAFPAEVQQLLQRVHTTIQYAAPDAEETISYAMPTFKLHGILVHMPLLLTTLVLCITIG